MKTSNSAGYSGTPLSKKLGIQAGHTVLTFDASPDYKEWLHPMPDDVTFAKGISSEVDLVHVFVTDKQALSKHLGTLRKKIRVDAAVWVSWPKKSSKVATNITEDTVRELALPLGFVDIKVCAVTDIWSGLKLVVRKSLR